MIVKLFNGKKFIESWTFESFTQAKGFCFDVLYLGRVLPPGVYTLLDGDDNVFVFELRLGSDYGHPIMEWHVLHDFGRERDPNHSRPTLE
jgi:hypothetical protein